MKPHDSDDFEALLRRMSPAPPRPELMAKLHDSRPQPAATITRFVRWLTLAAAACLAIFLALRQPSTPSRQAVENPDPKENPLTPISYSPLETRQHLMKVTDFGVIEDRRDRPFRLIGTTWVDEFIYAENPGGKRVTQTRVRQEVVPVSLQTY